MEWGGKPPRTQGLFRATERAIRSDRHFWATLNYIHDNPVRHGYAATWMEWPWSSIREYLQENDPTEVPRIWEEYPILDYGKGWDDPSL
jgi:putative transposase